VVVAFVLTVRQSGVESEWIELPLPACGLLAVLIAALGTFLIVDFYHKDQANRFANHAFIEARAPEPNLDTMTVLLTRALEHQPDQYFYRDELASCLLRSSRKAATPEKKQEYLRQAMIQARLARDTNFIFWTPQTRIGLFRDQFVNAPPALWYLERACKVAPAEPFVWYAAGKQRYDEGDKDGAWRDWKRSLALTPQHLNLIARDASSVLAPEDFVDRVLPDDADIVDRAMNRLHPDPAQAGDSRRPFLLKSLVLLERKGSERAAPDELQRGRILRELNRSDEAIAALREGIAKDFTLPILHWELALEYYERDMFAEAKKQVQIVLVRSPNDPPARELLLVVEREMLLQEP